MEGAAILSSQGSMTSFSWKGRTIRFRTSPYLERWERVTGWEKGLITAEARNARTHEVVEDYIDLVPILENLYICPAEFLEGVKEIRVEY